MECLGRPVQIASHLQSTDMQASEKEGRLELEIGNWKPHAICLQCLQCLQPAGGQGERNSGAAGSRGSVLQVFQSGASGAISQELPAACRSGNEDAVKVFVVFFFFFAHFALRMIHFLAVLHSFSRQAFLQKVVGPRGLGDCEEERRKMLASTAVSLWFSADRRHSSTCMGSRSFIMPCTVLT